MKDYLYVRDKFIGHMNHELVVNGVRKGDFSEFKISLADAKPWMEEHTTKLYAALYSGDLEKIREYAADVANIAMKIEECFGPKY